MTHGAEIAVVGGGPSGLVAALALAQSGAETVLFAPPPPQDRRTTALLDGSVRVLAALGIWPALLPQAAPLMRLRLVDATRRLIRAPEVLFEADELGLEAFGYNIENETLRRELRAAAERQPNLRIVEAAVTAVEPGAVAVALRAGETTLSVKLVVAADGRNSPCRKAAGIATDRREFPQSALAVNLRHSRPHGNISTEFHTESGPFTLVPLPGERSSLVWVQDPENARAMLALDDTALGREIEKRAHSMLGRMEPEPGRGSFPLAIEIARTLARDRIALVGEAGHVLPPIGAQGLNLGIRDAATIAELAADASRAGEDPGGDAVMDAYEARRRPDLRKRALAVELMNRSLLSDFLPVHALRGFGLDLAARFGFFRRTLMREGLGPDDADAPRLARGEAI
jgi:2-octaprenyl-6-methoxyphenol hydroxylase